MTQMNFPKELTANVLSSLNWGTADEAYTPSWFLYPFKKKTVNVSSRIVVLSTEPARGYGSEKHKTRLSKRKTASDTLFSVREELFAGEFEG
jgi:tRNA (adenine-N(1)-)-methyltransferase non-catalytic subunit